MDVLPGAEVGGPSASPQTPRVTVKAWPVRREHMSQFGMTPGCPGCVSKKGAGFQQAAHSDDCRERMGKLLDEQRSKREMERKRQLEEDRADEEQMNMDDSGEPSSSAMASGSGGPNLQPGGAGGGDQIVQGGDDVGPSGTKRKGGDQGVQDVDDLFRQAELEGESAAKAASIQAMSELMGSYKAARALADIAAMDVIEVFSPPRVSVSDFVEGQPSTWRR